MTGEHIYIFYIYLRFGIFVKATIFLGEHCPQYQPNVGNYGDLNYYHYQGQNIFEQSQRRP